MDCRAYVAKAVLPGGQLAEITRCAGTGIVKKAEDDDACWLVIDGETELYREGQ